MAVLSQKRSIDTSSLEQNFSAAEPATRMSAAQAVLSIKIADYPRALAELKKLTADRKITPDQRHSLRAILAKLERWYPSPTDKAVVKNPIPESNSGEISSN
jgi:hypothetical protein